MSTPFQLHIPRRLYDAMIAHAWAEVPNECCGLLAGVRSSLYSVLSTECYPLENAVASPAELRSDPRGIFDLCCFLFDHLSLPVEFRSEPRSMFDAVRDMRRLGIDILAVYHSHPHSQPTPSKTDLERNYSPDVVNLIISLAGPVPQMRAWWLWADGYREAEFAIV